MSAFQQDTLNELQDLIGGKLAELLAVYQEESARLFEAIVAAVADGNRDQLRYSAHSLKGASGNLGAMDVHRCSDGLEQAADTGSQVELEALLGALEQCHCAASLELQQRLASS